MRHTLLAGLIASTVATLAGMDATLDTRSIQEAIAIGQSRLSQERERYHRPYRVAVSHPPVDYLEVVTPFRRVELAAETRAAAGDRGFGQRQALELIAAAPDQIEIYVELTFHPLNTYVGVPDYRVLLVRAGDTRALAPIEDEERIPRYGARVDNLPRLDPRSPVLPGGSQPMLGGTIVARFDATQINAMGAYDVVVSEGGQRAGAAGGPELARARVDLALMR